MGAIILKNATYLAGFNLSSENEEALKNLSKKFRVRAFNGSDFGDFKKSFEQVKYHFGIIFQIDKGNKDPETDVRKYVSAFKGNKIYLDPEDLCPELSDLEGVIRLGKSELKGNSEDIISKELVDIIDGKMSDEIKNVIEKTLDYITPIFFSCGNVDFKAKPFDPNFFDFTNSEQYNCLVSIENNFEWVVGRLVIKINSDLFSKNILKSEKNVDDILKASQEYSNQIMGIINFNFNKSGRKFKIGLPQSYDLSSSRVNLGKLLIPSIIMTTEGRELEISFGYVEMENGTVPEMEIGEFTTPSSDVDFF
jgi:hypothetical protein